MNILIVASTFPRKNHDSQPRFVLDFAKAISRHHNVMVIAPYEKGFKLKENLEGINVVRFPYFLPGLERLAYRGGMVNSYRQSWLAKLQLPFFLFSEYMYVLFYSIKFKTDVINAHWLFPQGFVSYYANKLLNKSLIITTHGGDVEILKNRDYIMLFKHVIKNSNVVTFVSKTNLNKFKSLNVGHKNFKLLPMGIYMPGTFVKPTTSVTKILFIGRLVEIKGLKFLINSLIPIAGKHNFHLTIAGDGPLRNDLFKQTQKLNLTKHITFAGHVNGQAKEELLKNCDILVVPSIIDSNGYEEGLPVSLLEGMAYGKPVIATRTGSIPEILSKSKQLLVNPADVHDLHLAIEKLIKNKKLQLSLGKDALKQALPYEWSNIAERFNVFIRIHEK